MYQRVYFYIFTAQNDFVHIFFPPTNVSSVLEPCGPNPQTSIQMMTLDNKGIPPTLIIMLFYFAEKNIADIILSEMQSHHGRNLIKRLSVIHSKSNNTHLSAHSQHQGCKEDLTHYARTYCQSTLCSHTCGFPCFNNSILMLGTSTPISQINSTLCNQFHFYQFS